MAEDDAVQSEDPSLLPGIPNKRCVNCNTESTPLWRNGPLGRKIYCNKCAIRISRQLARQGSSSSFGQSGNSIRRQGQTNAHSASASNSGSPVSHRGATAGVLTSSRRARSFSKERMLECAAALDTDDEDFVFTVDSDTNASSLSKAHRTRSSPDVKHAVKQKEQQQQQHEQQASPARHETQQNKAQFSPASPVTEEFPDVDVRPADAAFDALCSKLGTCTDATTTVTATMGSGATAHDDVCDENSDPHLVQVTPSYVLDARAPLPEPSPAGLKASSSGVWSNGEEHA